MLQVLIFIDTICANIGDQGFLTKVLTSLNVIDVASIGEMLKFLGGGNYPRIF